MSALREGQQAPEKVTGRFLAKAARDVQALLALATSDV